MGDQRETGALVATAQAGDQDAFAALTGRYRREIQVHCYRMLGSIEDAEDAVQETLLRAWRKRETFGARSTFRAWLYGIATNTCLDALERRSRRFMPPDIALAADPLAIPAPASEIPWLEPYPDRLLEQVADDALGPDETYVARETIELAFLAAIQHLPPRQRAVLILRDVLGWSQHLPERRVEWAETRTPDANEQLLLERYMDAWSRRDVDALAALLAEDSRLAMPPTPAWYSGREAIAAFLANLPFRPSARQHIHVPTRANRQPAFAVFLAGDPGTAPRPFALEVLRLEDGLIAEIDIFLQPELLEHFAVLAPA